MSNVNANATQSTEMWYATQQQRAISLLDISGPNIALELGVMQFPSSPMLWNVPSYTPLKQDFVQPQNLCLLSGLVMPPYPSISNQLLIPSYKPLSQWLIQGENLNVFSSQDTLFGAAGQPLQTILPLPPVGYPIPTVSRTHINVQNPALVDIFFGIPGQPPTHQPPPNPIIAIPNRELLSWMQGSKLNLRNIDTFYASPGEVAAFTWIVPVGYIFPIALRTLINSLQQNLIGQDTILGVAGQPLPHIEFVSPRIVSFPYENRSILISEETPLVLVIPPVVVAPPVVVPPSPVVVIPAKGVNEVELGYALIRRFMELFRDH